MGNCFSRLPGVGVKKTVTLPPRPPSTDEASRIHSTFEECVSSLDAIGGARSSPQPKSEYFSARVELMMQTEDQFPSVVAHEMAHSKVHWSQVSDLPDLSSDTNADSAPVNLEYEAEVNRENEQVFAELMNDPQWNLPLRGPFFDRWPRGWHLGCKIAEGGQAEIFEVTSRNEDLNAKFLLKVFKRGARLSDLRRQWPHGFLQPEVLCIILQGLMLDDGRFAFFMMRLRGDLRKLIDQAMRERNNQGPPFPYDWNGQTWKAGCIMWQISVHMSVLHFYGILHRDLKAANVLVKLHKHKDSLSIAVADFECSIGVMGTTFWRAPEILAAVKNRSAIKFSQEADVYSYGMTCFEVVTGRLPFEGELEIRQASYDLIIEGRRPTLPADLDTTLKDLIERCWDPIPSARPTFVEIMRILEGGGYASIW